MVKKLLFVLMVTLTTTGCAHQGKVSSINKVDETKQVEQVELLISAAASLTDSLKEVQATYEKTHTNIKLTFNFGASGALQQQIEQGAPADLFISAGKKQMTTLVDKQLIDTSKQVNLLTNELVAVVPADSKVGISTMEDLTKSEVKKIAVGEPETVPVGSYTKDSLMYNKLWDAVLLKTVFAKDVRQVLNYVETGNTEVGFVYKTDALTSKKVKVAFSADPKSYKPIEYPLGIVKATKHLKETEEFYTFLQSKAAQELFLKYGFSLSDQ